MSATEVERLVLDAVRTRSTSEQTDSELIGSAVQRIEIGPDQIRVRLTQGESDDSPDDAPATWITVPWRQASFRRHRLVIAGPERDVPVRQMRVETRATLLKAIARGRHWFAEIMAGTLDGPEAIASREGCSRRHVNASLSLASLAPDIVEAADRRAAATWHRAPRPDRSTPRLVGAAPSDRHGIVERVPPPLVEMRGGPGRTRFQKEKAGLCSGLSIVSRLNVMNPVPHSQDDFSGVGLRCSCGC